MITVYEYLEYYQPAVIFRLKSMIRKSRVLNLSFSEWNRLMCEPPKPGRAGILPGESEAAMMSELDKYQQAYGKDPLFKLKSLPLGRTNSSRIHEIV